MKARQQKENNRQSFQTTKPRTSPNRWQTDKALARICESRYSLIERAESIHQYFTQAYMTRKGRSYLQAAEAANKGLASQFGEGSKLRKYSAYSLIPFPFADYRKEDLVAVHQAAGNEGRKAWGERKLLSAVDIHSLLAAEIPSNRSAREAMRDKEYAIVFTAL